MPKIYKSSINRQFINNSSSIHLAKKRDSSTIFFWLFFIKKIIIYWIYIKINIFINLIKPKPCLKLLLKLKSRPYISSNICIYHRLYYRRRSLLVMGKILYPYFENSPFIFQCIGTLLCLFLFAVAFNSQIGNGKTIGENPG